MLLPRDLNYDSIVNLSSEGRRQHAARTPLTSVAEKEKLSALRPATLGAAARISGITPASLVALLKFAKKQEMQQR